MPIFVISLSPKLQKSSPDPVAELQNAGAVLAWENVWLIECDEHPKDLFCFLSSSHEFKTFISGGYLVNTIKIEDLDIFLDIRSSLEVRKFCWDKIYKQKYMANSRDMQGNKYRYTNNGEVVFRPIIENFERNYRGEVLTTPLCEIMARHGSDKGLGWHNYTPFYAALFENLPDPVTSLFEVGLGTNFVDVPSSMGPDGVPGASLRAWKNYFSEAMIYGGDIDRRILFAEERIQTFFIDQLDPKTFEGLWAHMPHVLFDVFIDDGLHDLDAAINTFATSFGRVKEGGFYIIEDVYIDNANPYMEFLNSHSVDSVMVELDHPFNRNDNCCIVARRAK